MGSQRANHALLHGAGQVPFQGLLSGVVLYLSHHDIVFTGNRDDVIDEGRLIAQRSRITK